MHIIQMKWRTAATGLWAVLLTVALLGPLHAAEENTVESKLRDALRDTMLKLRDAQGQIATAQAVQIAAEDKIKELTTKTESLNKQLMAERTTSTNMIAELNTESLAGFSRALDAVRLIEGISATETSLLLTTHRM